VIAASIALCCIGACRAAPGDVGITWTVEPAHPHAGTTTVVRFTLNDARGQRLPGARLQLAAHMSHPGMTPITANVLDRGNGAYESRLLLSMAGNWTLVVSGELADGKRVTKHTEIAAAAPPL
jgi:hypothetical protein